MAYRKSVYRNGSKRGGGADWEFQYNTHHGKWELAPPHATPHYNTHTGEWQLACEDWELKYNPHDSTWKFVPPS